MTDPNEENGAVGGHNAEEDQTEADQTETDQTVTDQAEAGTEEIDPMEYYRQCVQWAKQLEVPVDWDGGEIGFAAIGVAERRPRGQR